MYSGKMCTYKSDRLSKYCLFFFFFFVCFFLLFFEVIVFYWTSHGLVKICGYKNG